MSKFMLAAFLLAAPLLAAPGPALAQITSPAANQANPQAQANMAEQPANASSGSGDASQIPTPTLNNKPMQNIPTSNNAAQPGPVR